MIHTSGTFEYEAEFTEKSFGNSEIVLHGSARSGENETRLVGLSPKIRFWNDRLVIVASLPIKAIMRNVSFPIGDAVNFAAQPGDQLYVVRTGCGGMGLSVLRHGRLILAIGAVRDLPLGEDLKIVIPRTDDERWPKAAADNWLEFKVGIEQSKLRQREVAVVDNYHLYVERCWEDGEPGTDESVSICIAGNSTMETAAMRSAILISSGNLKMVSWDLTEHFTPLSTLPSRARRIWQAFRK